MFGFQLYVMQSRKRRFQERLFKRAYMYYQEKLSDQNVNRKMIEPNYDTICKYI